jgi:glycosyltransferase involved in cell wall biosynthesis
MNVVHLGAGMIPVPPGDEPDGTEEYIYRLSHKVGLLGCNVTVIDVKAGEYQKQKRKESSARYRELCHPPLPHRYNHAFLQRIINFALLFTQSWSFAFLSALSLNRMLSRHEVDIIHPHFADSTLTAIFVNKLRGKPVCVIYDTHFPGLMTDLSWFQKLMTLNERLALKYADHVIVDTPSVKRRLVSVYHLEPAKITPIIQHGSFDEQEVAEYLLHKTKSVSEIKIVLCVSKISFTKNQLTVVKAVPKVIAKTPP